MTRTLSRMSPLFVLFLCCFQNAQSQSCAPAPSGLVTWWPGDGNTKDIIGGNNGTIEGTVTYAPGKVGQAFNFTGNGLINVAETAVLDLTNVTMEAWIYMNAPPSAQADYVIGTKGLSIVAGAENYGLYITTRTSAIELLLEWGAYGGSGYLQVWSTGSGLTAGAFHHVAATADGTHVTFYVDGNPVSQLNQTEPLVPNAGPFQIASTAPGYGNHFDGLIDELSVYNRALSASEIQAIFNAGAAGKCKGLTFSPASLKFPRRDVGATSPASPVTATNQFPLPVTIRRVTTSGDFAETNTCPAPPSELATGATCTIGVTFTPTAGGVRKGKVTVAGSAPAGTQTISLTGTGTDISLSVARLSFGHESVGNTSVAQTVTVTNVGSTTVNFTASGITIAGTNPADFLVSASTCGPSLANGTSCSVSVEFKPTATGTRSATLEFNDDGGASPQTVALSGSGK